MQHLRHRLFRFWVLCLFAWIGVCLLPISNRFTRLGSVALLLALWCLLLALLWHRRALRYALIVAPAMLAASLLLPDRSPLSQHERRAAYVAGLQRYEGARYIWGGESPLGIDCSGLVRRGLIDSLALTGLRNLEPESLRGSARLWWRDCTAADLLRPERGLTVPVTTVHSLRELDPATIAPGDLAVTESGIHVLAHVGGGRWIEADPLESKVVLADASRAESSWFHTPVRIVRWKTLAE
jgi:hypothetical protein